MRICLLTNQDLDSDEFPEDDWPCDPRPFLPEATWHVEVLEDRESSVEQVLAQAERGHDLYFNLCDGAADEDSPGIEVVQTLERLGLAFTGATSEFYEPSRLAMKRGIPPVEASHQYPVPCSGQLGQFLRLGSVHSRRLLDEHVHTGIQQPASDGPVGGGGGEHERSARLPAQQFVQVGGAPVQAVLTLYPLDCGGSAAAQEQFDSLPGRQQWQIGLTGDVTQPDDRYSHSHRDPAASRPVRRG